MAWASGPASPTWTCTWLTLTRRWALGTESTGSEASSTMFRLTFCPSTPPAALTSAWAAFRPWLTPAPNGANWPVREISEPKTIPPLVPPLLLVAPVLAFVQPAAMNSAVHSDSTRTSRRARLPRLAVMSYTTLLPSVLFASRRFRWPALFAGRRYWLVGLRDDGVDAQVPRGQFPVLEEIAPGAAHGDRSLDHQVGDIGDFHDPAHVLLHHEQRDPGGPQPHQVLPDEVLELG